VAELWVSKSDAGDLLGKDAEFVSRQILPRLQPSEKRTLQSRGRPWSLLGSAVVRAYTEWLAESETGDPAAFSLANSPALERQREARARLLEWELAERRKQLISVELFRTATEAAFVPLRRFAEQQIKEHGNGTADSWRDAVREFTEAIRDALGESIDTDGAGGVPGPAGPATAATADQPG